MERTKRERCKASAEKRLLSLEPGLTNTSRETAVSFSPCFYILSLSVFYPSISPRSPLFSISPSLVSFLLLTHTKSKLCESVDRSSRCQFTCLLIQFQPTLMQLSISVLSSLSFAQHLFCFIVQQQGGYCPASHITKRQQQQHVLNPCKLRNFC